MKQRQGSFLIQIILILLTALVFVSLNLYQGEFLDGLTYASISRNLALHQGSAFYLYYNDFLYPQFYEHPPLFFWLEAVFFRLMGDHFLVEKVVGILLFMLSCFFIKKIIYIKYQTSSSLFFIALLSMLFLPYIWVFKNNMLESLLVPILLAAYLLVLQKAYPIIVRAILFAILVILAFFTKGPFCIFMLAMFLFESLHESTIKWKDIVLFYLVLGICLSVSIIIFYLYPPTHTFFEHYFQVQLIKSMKGEREVSSRWIYINQLLYALLPLIFLYVWKKIKEQAINYKKYIAPVGLVLLYSVSVIVSPKQQSYYIVPCIPFLIIIAADLIGRIYLNIEALLQSYRNYLVVAIVVLVIINITAAVYTISTSKSSIEKYIKVSDALHKKSNIQFSFSEELSTNWNMIAVLSRYNNQQIQTKSSYEIRKKHVDTSLNSMDIVLNESYYLFYKQP